MPVAYAPDGVGIAGMRTCLAGVQWQWDGVDFRFLHPPEYFPYLDNDSSCVLRIETAHGAALLTGDIGQVVERDLLRRGAPALRADASSEERRLGTECDRPLRAMRSRHRQK